MEVRNESQAKTEKKTKNLGTFVILNQKSILNYVEEVLDKFEQDPGYKEKILKQMLPERKYKNTKKSQDYKLISKILKEEMGIQDAGETTIWRLLKIKEESPDLYNQIKENKISIRTAYNKLTGEDERTKKKVEQTDKPSLIKRGKLDFDKLIEELDYIDGELDKIADDESKQPSLKKMKQVDSQLFKIRKKLGSIIADNDPEKFI
nr:hypothetical protein [Clostridia bacterium]